MHEEIVKMNERYRAESEILQQVRDEVAKVIVGQEDLIEALLLALLCNGHVLIEGIPGLAKTLAVTTLAQTLHAGFNRIQFTPDLLPGDLIGTMMYNPRTNEFTPHKGPIFANVILADEINRSPAKVQSALLEAMQEHQVSIGDETYKLDEPFLVLATQNPVEQEGTYHLPEAQVDRFMFKLNISYPTKEEEHRILQRMGRTRVDLTVNPVMEIAVVPQDIKDVALDVLRHRLLLTYEAAAEETGSEEILQQILSTVEVP
jgi:MoxR-like ATPase